MYIEEAALDHLSRITHDPRVMGGKPCIRGLRVTAGTIVGLLAAVALSACDDSGESAGVSVTLVAPTPSPRPGTVAAATPTPTVESESDGDGEIIAPEVSGLIYPIVGACLPASYDLMPNAPRAYRDPADRTCSRCARRRPTPARNRSGPRRAREAPTPWLR